MEIMIVIVLIGLIGSVIGVNMKGSLEEGRAFKTRQAMDQIKDILMLDVARGVPIQEVVDKREAYLANSGLVKNAEKFLKDGWGQPFEVKVNARTHADIIIKSASLKAHDRKKSDKLGELIAETDEDTE